MSDICHLSTHLQNTDLINLKIGDKVLISGKIYTARDVAHQRLVKLMEIGQPLPFDIKGTVIYYAGPAPARQLIRLDRSVQPVRIEWINSLRRYCQPE